MLSIIDFIAGFALSGTIAVLFKGNGALNFGGRMGAVLLGTLIYGFAGLYWLLLMLAFFFSSSFLSAYKEKEKEKISSEKFQKYGARDFWQVIANGGVAAGLAILYYYYPVPQVFAAFLAAIAFANADTWATELGILNKNKPRLITSLKEVDTGTSGAVSPMGSLAAASGSFFIGLVAIVLLSFSSFNHTQFTFASILAISLAGGLIGAFVDSLIGATVQATYFCPKCKKETERSTHSCGTATQKIRGLEFMDNDAVNLFGSMAAAIIGFAIYALL